MLKQVQLYKPRASGLSNIMTDPRTKGEILSDGAKTYLDKCAKEIFYGYTPDTSSKYTDKGIEVEDQSIELYNTVFFTSYKKNAERRETDYLTGEPDLIGDDEIVDVKSSWSLDTFPASARAGEKKEYEWQARAYMHLFDKSKAKIAYCLVDTPDRLIGFEDEELHIVSHKFPPELRVTIVPYVRDMELEQKMIERCKAAQQYVTEELFRIEAAHKGI